MRIELSWITARLSAEIFVKFCFDRSVAKSNFRPAPRVRRIDEVWASSTLNTI